LELNRNVAYLRFMKKIIASAGMVALGAVSVQAAASSLGAQGGQPISASMAVRGFYDDNWNTRYGGNDRQHSYGLQALPSVSFNLVQEQTFLGAFYTYDMRWYADRADHQIDSAHEVGLQLKHNFSERHRLALGDTFNVFQEPLLTEQGLSQPVRANQNNLRNDGKVNYDWDFLPTLGLNLGYDNTWYHYADANFAPLLNRDTHLGQFNLRWKLNGEKAVLVVGYQFGATEYATHDFEGNDAFGHALYTDSRNAFSHYYFAGIDYNFFKGFDAMVRVGAQTMDYYKLPDSRLYTSPYADVALTYTYMKGSFAQLGFRNQRTATDLLSVSGSAPVPITVDAESQTFYAQVNQAITPKVLGTLTGAYQMSTFRGGGYNDQGEDMLMLGAVLNYELAKRLSFLKSPSAQVGYNFDWLTTDAQNRAYHRNRGFVGVRASF